MPWLCVLGHCHVRRHSHGPSSRLLLREGGCWPRSCDTWPHPSPSRPGQKKNIPKDCFHLRVSWLGRSSWGCTYLSSSSTHGEWSSDQIVLFVSDLVTFLYSSSGSSRCHWQTSDGPASLSRGTLRALQDFNPWRYSALLMVFLETVVPPLLWSLTRSYHVVLV